MRNYELIKNIYEMMPNGCDHPYTVDQYFDRCQDVIDLIERERPRIADEPDSGEHLNWKGGYIKNDS